MIKPLLLLVLLSAICFLTAKGQDTLKRSSRPRPYRPSFKTFLNRDSMIREHNRRDSIDLARPERKHPIIYLDFGFGGAFFGVHGLQGNYSLNYQYERSLFTFRGLGTTAITTSTAELTPFDYLPAFRITSSLSEYALMYGWRFTNHRNHAVSFSAGISTDQYLQYYYFRDAPKQQVEDNYIGVPFEGNWQWYMRRFGISGGFKISGNISQHSFLGAGVDMGLGFHNNPK